MQWWSDDVHPGLRYFDNQNIQDLNQDEQEEAKSTSRRVEKLGKAFQNYRRAIRNKYRDRIWIFYDMASQRQVEYDLRRCGVHGR